MENDFFGDNLRRFRYSFALRKVSVVSPRWCAYVRALLFRPQAVMRSSVLTRVAIRSTASFMIYIKLKSRLVRLRLQCFLPHFLRLGIGVYGINR